MKIVEICKISKFQNKKKFIFKIFFEKLIKQNL